MTLLQHPFGYALFAALWFAFGYLMAWHRLLQRHRDALRKERDEAQRQLQIEKLRAANEYESPWASQLRTLQIHKPAHFHLETESGGVVRYMRIDDIASRYGIEPDVAGRDDDGQVGAALLALACMEQGKERARLAARLQGLEQDNAALRAFARTVLPPDADEWGDTDMFDVQEAATKHGLLREQVMQEPCGEGCACAGAGADFPTTCYRFTDLYRGAKPEGGQG